MFEIYGNLHILVSTQKSDIVWFLYNFNNINPLDPTDLPFNMRYFPRISPNSLEISPKLRSNIIIQSPSDPYLFIKTK